MILANCWVLWNWGLWRQRRSYFLHLEPQCSTDREYSRLPLECSLSPSLSPSWLPFDHCPRAWFVTTAFWSLILIPNRSSYTPFFIWYPKQVVFLVLSFFFFKKGKYFISCGNASEGWRIKISHVPFLPSEFPFWLWLRHTLYFIMFSTASERIPFPQTFLHGEKNQHLTSQSAEVEWFLGSVYQGLTSS